MMAYLLVPKNQTLSGIISEMGFFALGPVLLQQVGID